MKFRPCIDIHNGSVKQIVGGSLRDDGSAPEENFVSDMSAADFALMYRERGFFGGHAIILNKAGTPEYEMSKKQTLKALAAFPEGLQVGGGINDTNAREFLDAGASHVIVTSFVFRQGLVDMERLTRMRDAVGAQRLVLDLSVRQTDSGYMIATDRWQKISSERLDARLLENLSAYCDEYLIHAADVEGKRAGVDEALLEILAEWEGFPITYAGGIASMEDIMKIKQIGKNKIDFTVGSALDIFGGNLSFGEIDRI